VHIHSPYILSLHKSTDIFLQFLYEELKFYCLLPFFTCFHKKAQQIVHVSKDIFELKQCVDMELHDEDRNWANNDSNVRC
jgi:hypothetical protein